MPISYLQNVSLKDDLDDLVPTAFDGIAELIESDDAAEFILALCFELE